MPAKDNPYRVRALNELTRMVPADGRSIDAPWLTAGIPEDISTQPIGLAATDIDSIARRNYTLGRKQARRDAEGEMQDLHRQLREKPATAYDEGYEAAEREVVELIANLLSPSAELAADITVGKLATGRALTPKQREAAKDQLVGSIQTAIRALEHAVREEVKTKIATGTIERLRDAMREHA